MNKITLSFQISILCLLVALTGCFHDDDDDTPVTSVNTGGGGTGGGTGGGSSGNIITDMTSVTSDNAQSLAVAATDGAARAIDLNDSPTTFGAVTEPITALIADINQVILSALQDNETVTGVAIDVSGSVCSTGSASVDASVSETTIIYSNCVLISASTTLNGTATVAVTNNGDTTTTTFSNFTVTSNGLSHSLNNTSLTCTGVTSGSPTCVFSSDFTGTSGNSYRVEVNAVTGNSSSGFNVSAKVCDDTSGCVTIEASNVLYDCSTSLPSTGSITYTGSNSTSGSVSFVSCTEYTVTFSGNSVTYTW